MQDYRVATREDSECLTVLVRRAKAHWGYPGEWMEVWQDELTITPDYIEQNTVIILELARQIAGFYGLEFKDHTAYLGHLWIEPAHIGQGLGKQLFTKVCREASDQGYSAMEWVADPNAEGFYLHHGAERIGEVHGDILGTPRVLPKMRVGL